MLARIGEERGTLLPDGMLQRTESPSLVHFVRRTVRLDRRAVQALFAEYLQAKNLTTAQIRFVETLIDQLTAQGVVESAALYEPPFSNMQAGGPDELFAGKDKVIEGIFSRLDSLRPEVAAG